MIILPNFHSDKAAITYNQPDLRNTCLAFIEQNTSVRLVHGEKLNSNRANNLSVYLSVCLSVCVCVCVCLYLALLNTFHQGCSDAHQPTCISNHVFRPSSRIVHLSKCQRILCLLFSKVTIFRLMKKIFFLL